MAVTSSDVADYLLAAARERGEVLTNLKLQKLLYYAQAWHLALYDEALFDEDFEAWVHGPVLPSQYQRYKGYSWQPITHEIKKPVLPPKVTAHLDEILSVFGTETAIALEAMAHAEAPWRDARGSLLPGQPCAALIPKESMKQFYKSLRIQG
jgi:uncharacterized phage-associated protein